MRGAFGWRTGSALSQLGGAVNTMTAREECEDPAQARAASRFWGRDATMTIRLRAF